MNTINEFIKSLWHYIIDAPNLMYPVVLTLLGQFLIKIITLCINYISDKSLKRYTENIEDQRNQDTIDADTIWKARVTWIQEIRTTYVDFTTAYTIFKKADEANSEDFLTKKINLQEKVTLLKLYFGPDSDLDAYKNISLNNTETNKGKNKLIVELIDKIFDDLNNYHSNKRSYQLAKNSLAECTKCQAQFIDIEEENAPYIAPLCGGNDGEFYSTEQCEKFKTRDNNTINECLEFLQTLKKNEDALLDAIRIYIKIEWNRAKKLNAMD